MTDEQHQLVVDYRNVATRLNEETDLSLYPGLNRRLTGIVKQMHRTGWTYDDIDHHVL